MAVITFGPNSQYVVGRQYVYVREQWHDDWELMSDMHCTEAVWCLSPTLPTATLVRYYGHVKPEGGLHYLAYNKLDIAGWYVKVVIETDVNSDLSRSSNVWYGIIGQIEDEQRGVVNDGGDWRATGEQTFHCYGLEKILDWEVLKESWVDIGEETPIVVQLPITFNRDGKPNCTEFVLDDEPNSWAFEGQDLHDPSYERDAAWWSTYYIVDYLLCRAVPKQSFFVRNKTIPFKIHFDDTWGLPQLDRPVVEQEGQTILAIINKLIDRRRLRAFYLAVDESESPAVVTMRIVAFNWEDIDADIPGVDPLCANPQLHTLRYDFAQNTSATLRKTHTQRYDRIIVRGARRTSTGTFFYDEDQMEAVWNGTEESAYEAAASGVTGYSGWTTLVKQQRNAEVRSSAELSHVFSWFWLPDDWNLKVESPSDTTVSNVFIGDTPSELVKQYIHDVVFEPYVPLYEHVDYSGDIVGNGTAADPQVLVYRQPQVWFKVPTDARYVAGDAIAAMAEGSGDPVNDGRNFRWSAYVRTQPDNRVLEVRVAGEQQHVIAETDFSPLAADRNLGDFDYHGKEMLVTATLRDNRYAEGAWPKDEGDGDDSDIDSRYGFIINAGDTFRQDYVVPDTVVDVATDGTLVTSNGGYVRDDTDILRGLARVAYEWWCIDRFILTLTTYQLTSCLQLGYMIMTIGHPDYGHWDDVGTVVSEIRVNWPILSPGQVASPTMRITTGSGELDPMTFAPREPEVLSRSRARTAR